MTEFVGRTGAKRVYSYPETPRGGGALAFARNSAFGPPGESPIPVASTGTPIPWQSIEAGLPSSGINVKISPKVTGLLRVQAVVMVLNVTGAPVECQVQVGFQGSPPYPVPVEEEPIVPANGSMAIPLLVDVLIGPGVVGSTIQVQIIVTAGSDNAIELLAASSSVDIQEMSLPTG